MNSCASCNKRILRHSRSVQCSFCPNHFHVACLPYSLQSNSVIEDIDKWLCLQCAETNFPFNHFQDDDMFMESVSENWLDKQVFPFHSLQHYEFNPFELNDVDVMTNIHNSDPDLQYFNDQTCVNPVNCDYYLEDGFIRRNSELKTLQRAFSLVHVNIRSMPKNLSNFLTYCQNLQFKFSVIGFSETWLTDSNSSLFGIDGYQQYNLMREKKKGWRRFFVYPGWL